MGTQQTLSIEPASMAQILPMLEPITRRKADTSGGMVQPGETYAHALAFVVKAGDQPVGAYALQCHEYQAGRVAWLEAGAGNLPGVDLTRSIVPHIEQQAKAMQADQIAIETKRPALVRKLAAMGYVITGVTMRKTLKNEQQ